MALLEFNAWMFTDFRKFFDIKDLAKCPKPIKSTFGLSVADNFLIN